MGYLFEAVRDLMRPTDWEKEIHHHEATCHMPSPPHDCGGKAAARKVREARFTPSGLGRGAPVKRFPWGLPSQLRPPSIRSSPPEAGLLRVCLLYRTTAWPMQAATARRPSMIKV